MGRRGREYSSTRGREMPGDQPIHWDDPEAVAACVETLRPRLLEFIARRMSAALRQRVDPDDIVQEVSLAAVRPAGAPPMTREPFGWLCHVAEQRIIDTHRRLLATAKRGGGRVASIDAFEGGDATGGGLASILAASLTSPSIAMSREAREARLSAAVAALPDLQREVIHMRYVEGLATRDIAERLGKSDVAIRVMLSRTIKTLEERLGGP
jgi:RNA polymerase sigma-70 factor (ECF subfamily)